MYLKSGDKSECSGCTACMNICPRNAIKMVVDEEGFKYPSIDKEKCIECGACYKICPNVKKRRKQHNFMCIWCKTQKRARKNY